LSSKNKEKLIGGLIGIIITAQHIESKGPVNNDFSRDKKVTTNQFFKEPATKNNDTVVVNNGFWNQGGSGNTYNQTINPEVEQRQLREGDMKVLDNLIGTKKVAFHIAVFNYDKESILYGKEIARYLKGKNAIQIVDPFGENISPVPEDKLGKIDFQINPDTSQFIFTIYPLH
jgi:hypothetical protein